MTAPPETRTAPGPASGGGSRKVTQDAGHYRVDGRAATPGTCSTCHWFAPDVLRYGVRGAPDRARVRTFGQCRRRPPIASLDEHGAAVWPETSSTDWCGGHEERHHG